MVIAHDVWTDRFGADPTVLGRRVRLGGVDFEVIGVAPEGFEGMNVALHPAYYIPHVMTAAMPGAIPGALDRRDFRGLTSKGD
jgi:hypothetical protein